MRPLPNPHLASLGLGIKICSTPECEVEVEFLEWQNLHMIENSRLEVGMYKVSQQEAIWDRHHFSSSDPHFLPWQRSVL
jgi:hypothetical protein